MRAALAALTLAVIGAGLPLGCKSACERAAADYCSSEVSSRYARWRQANWEDEKLTLLESPPRRPDMSAAAEREAIEGCTAKRTFECEVGSQ